MKGFEDVGVVYGIDQGEYGEVNDVTDVDYAKDLDEGGSITGVC